MSDIIRVQHLEKSFVSGRKKVEVLKDVDFTLRSGATSAVLGKSGSGKSTLLSLLAGLDRPDGGEISLLGTNIEGLSENELTQFRAKHIGIIFQHFHLLPHLNALENVLLALEISRKEMTKTEAGDRAHQALKEVGLEDRREHFPSMLSGGEKQRVAMARAVVTGPEILLADEPSGSLDEETGQKVMDQIFHLVENNQTSLVLVTHDEDLASRCDEQWTLDRGRMSAANILEQKG